MPKADAQAKPAPGTAGDTTRSRLLGAAATLIAERGWGDVTTRAIADRAGVNQALVHYHFGAVDNLLREAVMARLEPEISALADELVDERPFLESIHHTMALLDRFDLSTEVGILMAEALLRSTRDERMSAAMSGAVGSWQELLEPRLATAQQRGAIRTDVDPGALALVLAAFLDGFLIQRMAAPDTDPAAAADTLSRLLAPAQEDPR